MREKYNDKDLRLNDYGYCRKSHQISSTGNDYQKAFPRDI